MSEATFAPPAELLERYAHLIVDFALGREEGIAAGDTVQIRGYEAAKPLIGALARAVWRAGGHVLLDYRPDADSDFNLTRDRLATAAPEELDFAPLPYQRGMIEATDHLIAVIGDKDPHAQDGLDEAKLMRIQAAGLEAQRLTRDKESAGQLTWAPAFFGTPAMAAEAGLEPAEYWQEIIRGCQLDQPDPIAAWRTTFATLRATREALDALDIDRLHVQGPDADLWLTLGEQRRWYASDGINIPSFEVFTSPDWRGTEGWIRFSEPCYLRGPVIEGIALTFTDGVVTQASATRNEAMLQALVHANPAAARVGEFSLTDARVSTIDRFMAHTLFDENVGGRYGNTHLALGFAFPQYCYAGDPAGLAESDLERLGFNTGTALHTDFVSRTDRTVTAVLRDGTEQVIYADGQFQLD